MAVYQNAKDFDCSRCTWGRHCNKDNPAPIKQWVIKDVIESNTCLKPMITSTSNELISLYSHFSKNRFPLSGGLLDQPAAFVNAMEIIESAVENNDE